MEPPAALRRVLRQLPPLWQSVLLHARGDYAPWECGFDFTPPVLGPREAVGPPDFVGVGVQKGGTSWWYELLLEHPDVYARPGIPKERHFLTRFCAETFGPAQVADYHGWFPRIPGTITGEWTPDYFAYPWVAPLLARAAPDARLLVLVRDPVERFRSGLTFRLRSGAPHTSSTVADAVRQGFYARHLRRLYQSVPAQRVLVQQYEQCRADPAGELAKTYAFLGLEPFDPPEIRREINVSSGGKLDLSSDGAARLAALYRADTQELAELVPSLDISLWPSATGALLPADPTDGGRARGGGVAT